ncbi:MAG: glycosyltransferase family 4 protein [Opitutaceae bacterium]
MKTGGGGIRRIVFVNRYYRPDETATGQLLTELAEALAARGRPVTVLASRPAGTPSREVAGGVRIVRIASRRSRSSSVPAKALDWSLFLGRAVFRLALELRPGDTVVAMTDPPLLGVGAALVAAIRRARLAHWVQDIYPEIAVAVTGRSLWRVFAPPRNWAWRRADPCVVPGAAMAEAAAAGGARPECIRIRPNWALAGLASADPGAVARLRQEWGLAGRFVASYSGNLGRAHELDAILDLAAAVRGDPSFGFAIVGGGPLRANLERKAAARGLDAVRFLPAQPLARLATALAAADLHLITLRAGCERFVFPSKLYGAAAAGRPVLFLGPPDSEPARLIETSGFGQAFAAGDTASAAAALRELASRPELRSVRADAARRFALLNGGAPAAAAEWDAWLAAPL